MWNLRVLEKAANGSFLVVVEKIENMQLFKVLREVHLSFVIYPWDQFKINKCIYKNVIFDTDFVQQDHFISILNKFIYACVHTQDKISLWLLTGAGLHMGTRFISELWITVT